MSLWYALCDALGAEFLSMNFMRNALLAVIVMAPLFGLLSTMIVTGKMSFFSDALGHSGFTGIAIGVRGAADLVGCRAGGGVRAAVLVRAQPVEPVGGHDHRRLFVHSSRPRHLHRHDGRRELYQIQ